MKSTSTNAIFLACTGMSLLLGTGCNLINNSLPCEDSSHCPSGLSCNTDGICAEGGGSADDGGTPLEGETITTAGQVLISEVMTEPKRSLFQDQWLELHNPSTTTHYELQGCVIKSVRDTVPDNSFTVDKSLVLPAGGYLTFSRGLTNDPGFESDFQWAENGFELQTFARPSGELSITCEGLVIDLVAFDGLGGGTDGGTEGSFESLDVVARAMQVKSANLTAAENDDPDNWCLASFEYQDAGQNDARMGTPGRENDC